MFKDELTVFVISVERNENYTKCIEALKSQTVEFQLKEIKDVTPMSSAYNQMIAQCKTLYFIQIDEDMVLYKDAIESMYNSIKNTEIGIVCHRLLDSHLNIKIGTVKIYNYEIIKDYIFPANTMVSIPKRKEEYNKKDNVDEFHRDNGYKMITIDKIVGIHSPYWNIKTIFRHYFNFGERYCVYGIIPDITKALHDLIIESPTNLNKTAFLGFLSGILCHTNMIGERDIDNYSVTEFKKIKKYFKLNEND